MFYNCFLYGYIQEKSSCFLYTEKSMYILCFCSWYPLVSSVAWVLFLFCVFRSNYAWKDICQFRAFPSKSFISLQFFELDDDYIQEEIRKPLHQLTFTVRYSLSGSFKFVQVSCFLELVRSCNVKVSHFTLYEDCR